MNANDFAAWLRGFADAIDGQPTQKQWAKIKEQAAMVYSPSPFVLPTQLGQPQTWPKVGDVTCNTVEDHWRTGSASVKARA